MKKLLLVIVLLGMTTSFTFGQERKLRYIEGWSRTPGTPMSPMTRADLVRPTSDSVTELQKEVAELRRLVELLLKERNVRK